MYIWKNRCRCYARIHICSGDDVDTKRWSMIKYWSNSGGELHHHGEKEITEDELPEILRQAFQTVYNRYDSFPSYLVETENGYGISIEWSMDEDYAKTFGLSLKDLTLKMEELLVAYRQNYSLRGCDVYLFEGTEVDGNTVIFTFPADIPLKRIRLAAEAITTLDDAIGQALRLEAESNASAELQYSIPLKLKEEINREYSIDFEGDNMIRFGRYSPAGQNFGFSVCAGANLSELMHNVGKVYLDFDCSEEAYLWLDNSGHGKNGAPYDMKDVYEDMECCREYIEELRVIISDYLDARKKKSNKEE